MSEIERFKKAYDAEQPMFAGKVASPEMARYFNEMPAFWRLLREIIEKLEANERMA